MFGCNGKYNFPEIAFLLTKIYPFDPEMNLHSHFHFNSFLGHAIHWESERKNAERAQNKEQHRESERKNAERSSERKNQTIFLPLRAPIQPPRASGPKRNCLRREWEKEPTAPIYLTPVTPSSARRSPPRRTPDLAQPVDHRAKHFITVSFPSLVHRPYTHFTSDPHMSDPHTHLTSPISALYIYIYIYLYIYIFIYFFFIY